MTKELLRGVTYLVYSGAGNLFNNFRVVRKAPTLHERAQLPAEQRALLLNVYTSGAGLTIEQAHRVAEHLISKGWNRG